MKEEMKRQKGIIQITCLMILVGALVLGTGVKSVLSADKEIPTEIRIGDTISYTGPYASFGLCSFGTEAAI